MNSINPIENSVRPSEVLEKADWSKEQKEEYLENWRLDLLERMRATEENMANTAGKNDDLGDQLQQVDKALADLRGA